MLRVTDSPCLSPDAFHLPSDRKEEKSLIDYKKLYGDNPVYRIYVKEPPKPKKSASKEEQQAHEEAERKHEQFKTQFFIILDALAIWGAENKCEFQNLVPTFKAKFFEPYWLGKKDGKWFENYKANLETVWFHTQRADFRDIDKEAIDFMLSHAFNQDEENPTCSAGSGNDAELLVDILNQDVSMPRWLSRFCNNISYEFATKHIEKGLRDGLLQDGLQSHVYSECWRHIRAHGWPCSLKADENDTFITLTKDDVNALLKHMQDAFMPKNILERIYTDFKSEFQKLHQLKDNDEWGPYDKNRVTQIEFLLKKLELNIAPDQIFDYQNISSDVTLIRINEVKFKNYVLKELREKKRIFNSGNWTHRFIVTQTGEQTGTSYWLFNDGDAQSELFYLEEKDSIEIPFEKLLHLCQLPSPIQDQLKKIMIKQADEHIEKALKEKNAKFILEIIKAGYPLSRKNLQGNTAVLLAAEDFNWELVQKLLDLAQEKISSGEMQLSPQDLQLDRVFLLAVFYEKNWTLVNRLVQYQINVDEICFQHNGYCALHAAIYRNNIHLAQLLLTKGANPNLQAKKTDDNPSPLIVAAGSKQVEMKTFDWLLEQDVDPDLKTSGGHTALTVAAATGQFEKFDKLLSLCKRKSKTFTEQLSMTIPFAGEPTFSLERFNLLLELDNINLDSKNSSSGHTALTLAAKTGQIEKVKSLLMHRRKSKNIQEQLNIAFYEAIVNGHMQIAVLLAMAGASMEILPQLKIDDKNALDKVAEQGNWEMFYFLIKNGYPLNSKNPKGETPIEIAADLQKWDMVNFILDKQPSDEKDEAHYGLCLVYAMKYEQWNIVNKLLEFPIKVNWKLNGCSAFYYAILYNQIFDETELKPSIAKRLLTAKADINQANAKDGITTLHMAASKSEVKIETFKRLLQRDGINREQFDKNGNTSLMHAIEAGALEKVIALLELNVNFWHRRADGKAALDIAAGKQNKAIIEALISQHIKIAKKYLETADFKNAANLLIRVYPYNQDAFFNTINELTPNLITAMVDGQNCYAKLLETCINQAFNVNRPDAIPAILKAIHTADLKEIPYADFFFHILIKVLKVNNLDRAKIIMDQYIESKASPLPEPLLKGLCSSEIKFEIFDLIMNHPKIQQLHKNAQFYKFLLNDLINQKSVHINSLLKRTELMEMFDESKEPHPLSDDLFKVICLPGVTLETFNFILNHPKLQRQLNNDTRFFKLILQELVNNNAKDKMESLLKRKELPCILVLNDMKKIPNNESETYQVFAKNVAKNQRILHALKCIDRNDFSVPVDPILFDQKEKVEILLNAMPLNKEKKLRIQFILGELSNKPVNRNLCAAFKFDWYNQACLFLQHSSEVFEKCPGRRQNIRSHAFAAIYQEYLKLNNDPNQQIALIDKAKKEPVFVKKHHASKFFVPTDVLTKLDRMKSKAVKKLGSVDIQHSRNVNST